VRAREKVNGQAAWAGVDKGVIMCEGLDELRVVIVCGVGAGQQAIGLFVVIP
jgi:hypothetical protein